MRTSAKRLTNQRRELRRLNKYMQAYWQGFREAIKHEPVIALRCALAEKFGWQAVHQAEREYLAKKQEEDQRGQAAKQASSPARD